MAFAFRNDFPKSGVEPSWDRKEVARAIKQGRTVNKMMGVKNEPRAMLMRAGDALMERSKRPSRKFSKEWSDNKDREILAQQLHKRSFED